MNRFHTQTFSKWIAAVVLITGMANPGMANQSAQAFQPIVGKPLEGFTLPRIDNGDPVSLSDYRGKKLLLIMFASW